MRAPELFVGREAQLEQLATWLDPARSGGLVLVAGEAGVGKSRLLAEAVAHTGTTPVWSTCWEGDGAPAFWPWIQAIRACLGLPGGDAWRATAGPAVGEVECLLPERGTASLPVEGTRFRLFEGVADLVRAAAPVDGLVLVFDDLQWADESSLRLLAFVARSIRDGPVVVAGTYRDDEIGPEHPLRPTIAELAGQVRHLALGGLDLDELAALAAAEMGRGAPAPSAFVEDLHRLTSGNPFFAREVLALVRTSSAGAADRRLRVPAGVQAVIERRLARLSNRCEDALKVAAVLGSPFSLVELATVLACPEEEVLGVVDEAMAADLVRVDATSAGHLRFSHDLLRETLYASMAPLERARAHARVAEVLEAASADGPQARVAAIAHHLLEASPVVEPARAVEAAVRAGDRALAVLADEEAGDWYERALSVLRPGRADDGQLIELLLALGEARVRQGHLPAARSAYVEAAELARRAGRVDDLGRAALGLGAGLGGFEIGMFDHAQIDLLEDALAAIGNGDSVLRAQLLARLSIAVSFVAQEDRRLALSTEAVEMARRLGDASTLGHALAAFCDAIAGPEHSERRRATALEIIELSTASGDRRLELLGRRHAIVALLELGEIAAADEQVRLFAHGAEILREPLYRWYVPLWRGMRALMAGRTGESAALCEEAEALGRLAHSDNAAMLTVTQRWVRLRVEGALADAAELLLVHAAELFRDIPAARLLEALCALHMGRADEARSAFLGLVGELPHFPRDAEWLPTLAQAAELAAAIGDRDAAEVIDALLAPFDDRVVVEGIGAAVYGTLSWYRAPLADLLGRPSEAEQLRSRAAAAADAMGLRRVPVLAAAVQERTDTTSGRDVDRAGRFCREADVWALTFAGTTVWVRHSKGLQDLATLLVRPGTAVHVTELMTPDPSLRVAASARGEAVLDRQALADYRRRLAELDAELGEADDDHDAGRAARLRQEREFLITELSGALGLGGDIRRVGDDVDRVRKAVRARVRDAIERVEAVHPSLGRHLSVAVRTGTYCSYQPETPVSWTVE